MSQTLRYLTAALFLVFLLCGCSGAKQETAPETEGTPVTSVEGSVSASSTRPPETSDAAIGETTSETETIQPEETTEEETEDVEIPDDVYRFFTTVNPYGSWQASDSYDDYFAVTYDGNKVTVDNYLKQGDKKGLLESFELTERDSEHEKTVSELLSDSAAKELNVESYKLGDKYIDILPESGIVIREAANESFMFYVQEDYDNALIENYAKAVEAISTHYSTVPFPEEETSAANGPGI